MKKTFIVTGAGSGIGRAIAQVLAADSSDNQLILLGRNTERLRETVALLDHREQHQIFRVDLRDHESIRSAFREARLPTRNVCGVIANAGVGGENDYGPKDRWDEIIETNLGGTYALVNESLPALRASQCKYKNIVVISSILARIGVPPHSAYCASKAGLLGLTRSWASEFASEKILVNAICPGWVDTQMSVEGIDGIAKASGKSKEATLDEQMRVVPLRKMSEPREVAELVRYLVSESQISITGQSFDINNGALMV